MMKKITILNAAIFPVLMVVALLMCDEAMAGPTDNIRQMQRKEVTQGLRPQSPSALADKPAPAIGVASEQPAEGLESPEAPAEEKIKIEVSEKEIDQRVPSYKKSLKDIIRDADANIRKIDDALKCEDNDRSAQEHYNKGTKAYNELKFEEAGKEWETALGLAQNAEFRKHIRCSLKRAARDIRLAREKREAEEWEKKKAELKAQREAKKKGRQCGK